MFNDYIVNGTEYKWIITIKTILDNLGMGNIWLSQTFTSVNCLSQHIKQRQCDQYLQIWRSNMSLSSRGKTYQIYKEQILTVETNIKIQNLESLLTHRNGALE